VTTVLPAIVRKELKGMFTSRGMLLRGVGASVFFGFVLFGGGADTALFFAPLLVGLGMAYFGSTEVFLQEKASFVIETLLCSPATLQALWLGKTLAATLFGSMFSLAVGQVVLLAVLHAGALVVPGAGFAVYLVLVVPLMAACFAGLRGYVQLLFGMRESHAISLGLLMLITIVLSVLSGLSVNSPPAFTPGLVAALGFGAAGTLLVLWLCSRFLSVERVVTSL